VDIVADTGSVGRGIIIAVDFGSLALTQGCGEQAWDQMGFRNVAFADGSVGTAPAALK